MKRLMFSLIIIVSASIVFFKYILPHTEEKTCMYANHPFCESIIVQISSNTICFDITNDGFVCVEIFNILGQKIKVLANEYFSEGSYCLEWDGQDDSGQDVSNSVYFYRMTTDECWATKKVVHFK